MSFRIERFSGERPICSLPNSNTFSEAEWRERSYFVEQWDHSAWEAEHWLHCDDQKVEKAAQGILQEVEKESNEISMDQANEIAALLISMAKNDYVEIQKLCCHLYTRETFLYRLINKVLRE